MGKIIAGHGTCSNAFRALVLLEKPVELNFDYALEINSDFEHFHFFANF